MQQITLSGWATRDSELYVDNVGKEYKRFTIRCMSLDRTNRKMYTEYTCYSYLNQLADIKRGDEVFLTGKQSLGITQDEKGNFKPLANVVVHQITVRRQNGSNSNNNQ